MGSPVNPSYVNLFMGKLELSHVDHDHTSPLLTFGSDIFVTYIYIYWHC